MKQFFRIRPEYLNLWGEDATLDTVVTLEDVSRLSSDWEVPFNELMSQVIEIDFSGTGFRGQQRPIVIDEKLYTITSFTEHDPTAGPVFSFYIQPFSMEYPASFMFSVPTKQQSWKEAFQMAEEDATQNIEIYGKDWI